MTRDHRRRPNDAGYSLIEMMFTVGILGVLGSMAVISMAGARPAALGDGALRVVLSQMNTARELAITQRKNMRVTFTANNTVSIVREEVPGPTLTTLSAIPMEGGLQLALVTNLSDTPDKFCPSLTAICFPTATGTPPEVKFRPDGTFVNQDGAILNGTLFVAMPNQVFTAGHSSNNVMSARAITIQGSTGRVRGYRYDGGGTAPNGTNPGYWKPV